MDFLKKAAYAWIILVILMLGCGSIEIIISNRGSALLVGSFRISDHSFCPEQVRIVVNENPTTFEFDPRCEFAIKDFPTGNVLILIQADNITGTFRVDNVEISELLEIVVVVHTQSLSLSIIRRVKSSEIGMLPVSIEASNLNIQVPAGLHEQSLTVDGDNFIMTGAEKEQLDSCISQAWTTITGNVSINGNNATFRNIKFLGDIEVKGNKVRFIHSCVRENFLIFGNESTILPFFNF